MKLFMGQSLLTITVIPSIAIMVAVSPFSISESFSSREAIPISQVPSIVSDIPVEESLCCISIVTPGFLSRLAPLFLLFERPRSASEVLHNVAVGAPVFLTKNGRGLYACPVRGCSGRRYRRLTYHYVKSSFTTRFRHPSMAYISIAFHCVSQ